MSTRRRGLADNQATRNKVGNGATPGDHRVGDEAQASRRSTLGKMYQKETPVERSKNEI